MKEKRTRRPVNVHGCRIHDDCLNCPLPICIEDMTRAEAQQTVRKQADERIDRSIREMTGRGMTLRQAVTSLAGQLGMKDSSSIYRRLKRRRLEEEARGGK